MHVIFISLKKSREFIKRKNQIMKEMWDTRYSSDDYAYGTTPNKFLEESISKLKLTGKILFPAEGEGRNAVFCAKQGMDVSAFDISIEGKKKALSLAAKENVKIKYEVGELSNLNIITEKFDVIALIYAHFPPAILSKYHRKIANLLEVGGMIILEGFSKNHLAFRNANPKVGGPDKIEMLFSKETIQNDFPNFKIIKLEEIEVELNEGNYHNGIGKVIRFIGEKI